MSHDENDQNDQKDRKLQWVGKARRRVDGRAKVTGQTRFADDIVLPRMLFCKLLRSPHPHARVLRIDPTRALAHPVMGQWDGSAGASGNGNLPFKGGLP